MGRPLRLLILAGSAEARDIAQRLIAAGHSVQAVKSEPPRGAGAMPAPFEVLPQPTASQIGDRLAGVDAVIDAAHAFDVPLRAAGHQAAGQAGVPLLTIQRPGWSAVGQDRWHQVPSVQEAMPLIPEGAHVFSATGWASLPEYAGFPGRKLSLRQTALHDRIPPFPFVELVFGTPPFTVAEEGDLFERLKIDSLICRNLGGAASRPKLEAAQALGLQVILIDRPKLADGTAVVEEVDAVIAWVEGL